MQQSRSSTLAGTLRDIFSGSPSSASPSPIRQLWRGTVPSALRTGCGSALYFGGLNLMRSSLARGSNASTLGTTGSSSSSLPALGNWANLATGALARTAAGLALMPVTVIKVRYESSMYDYRGLAGAARGIWRAEGARGFFAGFGATAVRDAPYAGLYVLFYEQSKRRLGALVGLRRKTTGSSGGGGGAAAGVNFASGALAAGLATAATNPFDAIKTRLQLMPARYGNTVRAARTMLREEGARSMFDGLGLRMARKALSSALAWTVYEELVRRAEASWAQAGDEGVL